MISNLIHRLMLALVAPLATVVNVHAQSTAHQAEDIVRKSRQSIVKIVVDGFDTTGTKKRSEGTGFFIASNARRSIILTAAHVIGSDEIDPNKNQDWGVELSQVKKSIEISAFDDHGSLISLGKSVSVIPTGQPMVDIAVLEIDRGGFPIIGLQDPMENTSEIQDVMLLGIPAGKSELTKPYPIGTGQLSGIKYVTSVPSHAGESGGPWIDIQTGLATAVASMVNPSQYGTSNVASITTMIRPLITPFLDTGSRQIRSKSPKSSDKVAESVTSSPVQDRAPAEFAGLDVLYFERPSDGDRVRKVLDSTGVKWRRQTGETLDASNVVTCAPGGGLAAAKILAKSLLESGVKIQGIAPQASPILNKVTVEFYPEYSTQPVLTATDLDNISECPSWDRVLSANISVKYDCSFGSIDIYLRYYDPFERKYITKAKYGLGAFQTWNVTDASGRRAVSGKPYVGISVAVNNLYYNNYPRSSATHDENTALSGGQSAEALDQLPASYFRKSKPNSRYTCPVASSSWSGSPRP